MRGIFIARWVCGLAGPGAFSLDARCRLASSARDRTMSMFRTLMMASLFAAAPPASATDQGGPKTHLPLDAVIEHVLDANPRLSALQARAGALRAAGEAASAMPDPTASLAINDAGVALSSRQSPSSMRQLMLRQTIPWPGKRALRREVRELLAEAIDSGEQARELALTQAATMAYADLWLAVESGRLWREQRETLSEILELARVRYETLGVTLSDPLRAELALLATEEPLAELHEREEAARATLALLMGRAADEVSGEPSLPPAPSISWSHDELLAVVEAHPALSELERRHQSALAEARLAEREALPDPTVGVGYAQRDAAPDMIGVEVMVPLPVFGRARRASEARAARMDALALEETRRAERDELFREARAARAEASRADAVLTLYSEELIPLARRTVQAARLAYESGQVELTAVMEAQLDVLRYELSLLSARAAMLRADARLTRALGATREDRPSEAEITRQSTES